jgi:undecaprenyl-diphosphatase
VDIIYHYLQIVLLGIVEGVTEFLPISSTGHLLIAEHLLGSQEPDIFNVVIQAGAILAVVFIYWHKIVALVSDLRHAESRNYLIKIFLAFLVTTVLVLLLTVKFKLKLPESLTPVAWATFLGGFVIFGVEAFIKNRPAREGVTWFEAALVGAGQVVAAIFPGASRSGSTIMAGLAVGMKRPTVTEFSFLVGIPTMFAASAYDTLKSYKAHELEGLGHQIIIDTVIGFLISMVVAFFVVKWLLRFVQSHTFNGFAIYRVILGGGLLIALYTGMIPDVSNEKAKTETPILTAPGTNSAPIQPLAPATDAPPVAPAVPSAQ